MAQQRSGPRSFDEATVYTMRFNPVIENVFDANERRERIQMCLAQMFIRSSTLGRPKKRQGELDEAA